MRPVDEAVAEPDWDRAWVAALDELELSVADAEQLLVGELPPATAVQSGRWVAPTDLGPLPETLQDRAIALNQRQLEVAGRIALALAATRKEHDLVHRLSRFTGAKSPIYVDHLM